MMEIITLRNIAKIEYIKNIEHYNNRKYKAIFDIIKIKEDE